MCMCIDFFAGIFAAQIHIRTVLYRILLIKGKSFNIFRYTGEHWLREDWREKRSEIFCSPVNYGVVDEERSLWEKRLIHSVETKKKGRNAFGNRIIEVP